jgi:superfamily I DNA/RNA helicase
MSVIKLSKYQEAVIAWVRNHIDRAGALIVEAVAGSGKTFTIVRAAQEIPADHKAVFLAFNKSIATELGNKLPDHVESKTLNALGWAVCRYRIGKHITIERNKTRDLIDKLLPEEAREVQAELLSIIGKAKSHGLIPAGMPTPWGTYAADDQRWVTLMDRYDIDPNGCGTATFISWCNILLKAGLEEQNVFDFDDQLYMPVALDLPTWGYDWVIIDEAQDVSHVQRVLLRKFKKRDGRLIAVGDSRQAIYGFRGADSQSLANIGRVFKAETLPLSISYRCPRLVVEEAQHIVPHIECSDTAEDGEILSPNSWQVESFSDSDLVVCRTTAPLIELAYKCISEGKQVHVMGREIGKGLINVIKKAGGKRTKTIEALHPKLDRWQERMIKKADKDESKIAAIQDKRDCINVLAAGLDTVAELIAAIEKIFSDSHGGTTLATVHKAKGLEAPRVFILNPDGMPSKWARQDWQIEQEMNLKYVAVTRALETLVYLPLEIVGA